MPELAGEILGEMDPSAYPHLAEFAVGHVMQPGYAFGDSFEVGLDLVLEGLERWFRDGP